MKFYSEKLKKLFNTEAELVEAEKRQEEEIAAEELKKKEISNEKKKAATKIESATEAYEKASEEFELTKKELLKKLDDAEEKAAKIISEANDAVEKELKEAKEKLRQAKIDKVNAIADFNKDFGPYKKVYTGQDALKKLNEDFDVDYFDRLLNKLNKWF